MNINKQNLFIDADNTLINSTQRIAELYNKYFVNHPNFTPAKWWECTDYEMKSICPLMTHEYKMNLFDSYEFFNINELDLINENTYDILKELNDKYSIFIFSIGRARNISLKSLYFDYKVPFIKNYIFYRNSNCEPNKSIVDARGGIFIDDMPSNLDSSSASYKLLFGEECEWTKSDKYKRVVNWTDIGNLLL